MQRVIQREDGGALISVVLVVFLLALLAVGVMQVTLNARQTLQSVEVEDKDLRVAQSALRLFMKEHFYNADEKAFLQDLVPTMERNVEVRVSFESGKININRANASLLSALMVVAGKPEPEARDLAAAIIDWRDKDSEAEAGGAELEEYIQAGKGGGPRNGPFESVGELVHVLGMDETFYFCIRPTLTVASLSGEVDLSYANEEVRAVIQWAYDNDWDDQAWPDPSFVERAGGIIGNANTLGGQALKLSIVVPSSGVEKVYEGLIRFKSTSDMSYAYLVPVARKMVEPNVSGCPW